MNQCRTMLVGSKRLQLAPASTTCPSAGSKFLIISICSRSSFDRKFNAKKTWTETTLFRRKISLGHLKQKRQVRAGEASSCQHYRSLNNESCARQN